MKNILLVCCAGFLLAETADAQTSHFLPGHLAVLRAGNGTIDLQLRQAPLFVDQFDAATFNAAPSLSVPIPTNGAGSFFINGHASSEGGLTRSMDQKLLVFAGYGGVNLLQVTGTASRIDLQHGICTVDGAGAVHSYLYKSDTTSAKVNPRGAVGDGTNNFWGAGNANGTFYFNPNDQKDPVRFRELPNTRFVKIINNRLYASMNSADAYAASRIAGIYSLSGLPRTADASTEPAVPSAPDYKNVTAFDISPAGDVAYMADTSAGIQKYVKSGVAWKFAYNISVPQVIPKEMNHGTGCFGVTVDFSGKEPIVFATTTEGYGDSANSNRVVRVVDTGTNAVVTTVAQAGSTNMVFRGIDFTPN
jgi:hypothetical protein